jgi:hypothetical protein
VLSVTCVSYNCDIHIELELAGFVLSVCIPYILQDWIQDDGVSVSGQSSLTDVRL